MFRSPTKMMFKVVLHPEARRSVLDKVLRIRLTVVEDDVHDVHPVVNRVVQIILVRLLVRL